MTLPSASQGKPVARRGRKARGLVRETAHLPAIHPTSWRRPVPLRSILAALLVALVAAPAASASTTRLERGTLTYAAAPGEANDVKLSLVLGSYVIEDSGAASLDTIGRDCHLLAARVMCDARRVKSVVVDLGDGDDIFADDGSIAVQL